MTTETPPAWAIERALKLAEMHTISVERVQRAHGGYSQTLAHAATLAKYEQPPVDPVALVLINYYEEMGCFRTASNIRANINLWDREIEPLRVALEKNGFTKGPTQ